MNARGRAIGHSPDFAGGHVVQAATRRLRSYGLVRVGAMESLGRGWHVAHVVAAITGEPCGKRWIRWTSDTGWDVRKERP